MRFNYYKKSVRSAAILTTSYVAGTVLEEVHDQNQMILNVDFTIGSLTSAEIKVEFSSDNTNWYQETFSSVSGGTSTESLGERSMDTTGKRRIAVPLKDRYVRVSVKGTGIVTGSSMAIEAIIGRS